MLIILLHWRKSEEKEVMGICRKGKWVTPTNGIIQDIYITFHLYHYFQLLSSHDTSICKYIIHLISRGGAGFYALHYFCEHGEQQRKIMNQINSLLDVHL